MNLFGFDESSDPDELAIFVADLLRDAADVEHVSIQIQLNEAGETVAIEVWRSGKRIVAFYCQPTKLPPGYQELLHQAARPACHAKPRRLLRIYLLLDEELRGRDELDDNMFTNRLVSCQNQIWRHLTDEEQAETFVFRKER